MRIVKFKVYIPKPDILNEYEEFEYNTPAEVCDALKIKRSTMYSIINNKFKCAFLKQKYLEGIKIKNFSVVNSNIQQKTKDELINENKQIQQKLLETLRLKKNNNL